MHTVLVRKSEGKSSFGRPRDGWENAIKMDFRGNVFGCNSDDRKHGIVTRELPPLYLFDFLIENILFL